MDDAYNLLDQDGDGFVTRQDLLRLLGTFRDDETMTQMIEEADFDSDGKILKDDWIHMMMGTTPEFGDPAELRAILGVDLQFDAI